MTLCCKAILTERQPIFMETGRDFIGAGIERDRIFLDRYDPDRDRMEFEKAWRDHEGAAAPRVLTYEPHYEGSPIVFGPAGGASSARGSHTFKARAGHHLPPQPLSSGRNVFEELGPDFTLLAFEGEDQTVAAFEKAARSLGVPLKIVCDSYQDERTAYEAKLMLDPARPLHCLDRRQRAGRRGGRHRQGRRPGIVRPGQIRLNVVRDRKRSQQESMS